MPFWRRRAKPRKSGEDAGPSAHERGPDEGVEPPDRAALPDEGAGPPDRTRPPDESFPHFRYFPDALAAGVFVESDSTCDFCGAARGYVYVGPHYALEEYVACPWCIADGSAAARSDGEFTDVIDVPPDVPPEVVDELAHRTPGFMAWQQERWLFHCSDAMAFLGPAGRGELDPHPDAIAALADEFTVRPEDDERFAAFLDGLDPAGAPTAYLFRCLHCGTHLAYSDTD